MAVKYKRCKRYNDEGHAHALTFTCFRGRPFLSGDRARGWLIDAINLARKKHTLHVWAYVVMPEHAHLVVWPTQARACHPAGVAQQQEDCDDSPPL